MSLSTDLRHVDRLRVEAVHQLAEHHAIPEQECEVVRAGGRGEARVAVRHHLELVQPPQALLPQRLHAWADNGEYVPRSSGMLSVTITLLLLALA